MAEAFLELFLVQVFIIFLLAKLSGLAMRRLGQPSVLGEIAVGIILGNLVIGRYDIAELLQIGSEHGGEALSALAHLGIILLLFIIGMHITLGDLKKVGKVSISVGVVGMVLPFLFGVSVILSLGAGEPRAAMFVGVALMATSVGVTARLCQDLKRENSRETVIVMGAAVMDDVLGLVALSIAVGIASGSVNPGTIMMTVGVATAFVMIMLLFGERIVDWAGGAKVLEDRIVFLVRKDKLTKLGQENGPIIIALAVCFGMAALASLFGLAAIVGAFLAGMAFADVNEHYGLTKRIEPVEFFLVPFFFVLIGVEVDISLIYAWDSIILITLLFALAMTGKVLAGLIGAWKEGRASAILIGLGMAPRGEVMIIVAQVGLDLGVLSESLFGALVVVSMLTILAVPPLFKSTCTYQDKCAL